MYDPKQLEILKKGVPAWNEWRNQNPDANVNLSSAKLMGFDLENANFARADLGSVDFSKAKLIKADLTAANLKWVNLSGANVSGLIYDRKTMMEKYRGIRVASCYGNAVFKRDAQDQDYIDAKKMLCHSGWRKVMFAFWAYTDYGRSFRSVFLFAVGLVIVFGFLYCIPGTVSPSVGAVCSIEPYYFSVVTFTTLGYGDVHAANAVGKALVMFEVVLGYGTLGLLLSVLANKVARRS